VVDGFIVLSEVVFDYVFCRSRQSYSASPTLARSHSVSLGLIRSTSVSLGLTRPLSVSVDLVRSHLASVGLIRPHPSRSASLGLTGSYSVSLGLTRSQWVSFGLTRSRSASLGLTRSRSATLGLSGSRSASLGLTRSHSVLLGLVPPTLQQYSSPAVRMLSRGGTNSVQDKLSISTCRHWSHGSEQDGAMTSLFGGKPATDAGGFILQTLTVTADNITSMSSFHPCRQLVYITTLSPT